VLYAASVSEVGGQHAAEASEAGAWQPAWVAVIVLSFGKGSCAPEATDGPAHTPSVSRAAAAFPSLADYVQQHVPRLLVNREKAGEAVFGGGLLGQQKGFTFGAGNYRCEAGSPQELPARQGSTVLPAVRA
jgi:hypothetical protein